ncbi:putative Myosin heavy chain kinase B [Glarea lozoyensis 74030]|uniref:Putative Myosin heavy chain kinase B n=1 Tax=Glarea lozoyensis (strain ATCC 74030 / MF5533) TaxID=1104152 RepID=H0EHU0_GLAL7|nr:putative Myosin heavy chain kinase B [Glarea lozoyensis 74030]
MVYANIRMVSRKFVRSLKGHTDTIRSIHIPDPLSTAISGSKDGRIIIWDLKLGKHTAILKHESQDAIRTIALKHDAAFAGTYAGKLIRWDLSTRQCRSVLNAHDGVVYAIVVGDEEVFTAGSDGSIVSWDLETRMLPH